MIRTEKVGNIILTRPVTALFVLLGMAAAAWTAFGPSDRVELTAAPVEVVEVEQIDVALGVPAMSDDFREVALNINEALRDLDPADRAEYVQTHYPRLGPSIVSQLRARGMIAADAEVSSLDYYFGSLEGVQAQQADGPPVTGKIDNQLIALVSLVEADPVAVIVLCSNGMLDFSDDAFDGLDRAGTQAVADLTFTIEPGNGLVSYVSYQTAMDIAERNDDLVITKTIPGRSAEVITVAEARLLEDQTDSVLVTVHVHPGDTVNVATLTHTPAA